MGRVIYDSRDLETASSDIIKGIDKAVLATAFKVRDDARNEFLSSKGSYKYATQKYDTLAEGIMVGKLNNSTVKVHALGSNENYHSYKARFFVGGTAYRTQISLGERNLNHPYTKGYIKNNDALDKAVDSNSTTLNNFINNVLNNG